MGYSQFLNMIPEAFLVLALILVFIADFIITNVKVKGSTLVLGAQVAATLVSADLIAGKVEFRILPG